MVSAGSRQAWHPMPMMQLTEPALFYGPTGYTNNNQPQGDQNLVQVMAHSGIQLFIGTGRQRLHQKHSNNHRHQSSPNSTPTSHQSASSVAFSITIGGHG